MKVCSGRSANRFIYVFVFQVISEKMLSRKDFISSLRDISRSKPILAKEVYDICKFQLSEKVTVFRNILNIRQRYLYAASTIFNIQLCMVILVLEN